MKNLRSLKRRASPASSRWMAIAVQSIDPNKVQWQHQSCYQCATAGEGHPNKRPCQHGCRFSVSYWLRLFEGLRYLSSGLRSCRRRPQALRGCLPTAILTRTYQRTWESARRRYLAFSLRAPLVPNQLAYSSHMSRPRHARGLRIRPSWLRTCHFCSHKERLVVGLIFVSWTLRL